MPIDKDRESWKPGEPWEKAIDEIDYIKDLATEMGGAARVARQHLRSKKSSN